MEQRKPTDSQEQRNEPNQHETNAERQTPLAERVSETGMDQLEEKTERVTHTNESENKEGAPWSPGQASS